MRIVTLRHLGTFIAKLKKLNNLLNETKFQYDGDSLRKHFCFNIKPNLRAASFQIDSFQRLSLNKKRLSNEKCMLKRILISRISPTKISVSCELIVISQQRIIKAYHDLKSKEINPIPLTPELYDFGLKTTHKAYKTYCLVPACFCFYMVNHSVSKIAK